MGAVAVLVIAPIGTAPDGVPTDKEVLCQVGLSTDTCIDHGDGLP